MPSGAVADDIRALHEIYAEAGLRTAAWARDPGFGCPHGCGVCCEAFVPDCLPVEAEYLAHYLLSEKPAAAARMLEPSSGPQPVSCPLYDPSSPFHCSVYAARPLVCRLFAFAGSRRKQGGWAFKLCRHMPAPAGWGAEREITDTSRPHLAEPPLMSQIEARVQGLRPADAGLRKRLPEALRDALGRVLLTRALSASAPSRTPG